MRKSNLNFTHVPGAPEGRGKLRASELAATKNILPHTHLPHRKPKVLLMSEGSMEMEVRRGSLREDIQGSSLSLKRRKEGDLIPPEY